MEKNTNETKEHWQLVEMNDKLIGLRNENILKKYHERQLAINKNHQRDGGSKVTTTNPILK